MSKLVIRGKSPLKLSFTGKEEHEEFQALGLLKSSKYFIIESEWLESWTQALFSGTQISKMRTQNLLDSGRLKQSLRYPKDYKILNIQQWIFLNAKYGSEPPIELKSPFDLKSVSDSISVPHYLSSPCTTRTSLESLSTLKDSSFKLSTSKNFESLESTSINLNVFGFLALRQDLRNPLAFFNVLIGIQAFRCLIQDFEVDKREKIGKNFEFLQVLKKLIEKIVFKKFCVVKSERFERVLMEGLKGNYGWSKVLKRVESKFGLLGLCDLVKVDLVQRKICKDCGVEESSRREELGIDLEVHKSVEKAIEYFESLRFLEERCEACDGFLQGDWKIEKTGHIVYLKINRERELPYHFKVWNKIKYKKILDISGKKFTLFSVICENPGNQNELTLFCKRGKGWYIFKDNLASKVTLIEALNQIAIGLVYAEL